MPNSIQSEAVEGTVRKLGFRIASEEQQAACKRAFVLPDKGPALGAEGGTSDDPDLAAFARSAAPALQDKVWHRQPARRLAQHAHDLSFGETTLLHWNILVYRAEKILRSHLLNREEGYQRTSCANRALY